MKNQREIDKIINDEYQKFYNSSYGGKVGIPENVIELVQKCFFTLPPHFHKLNASKIKVISEKLVSELTNMDINDIIILLVNTPLCNQYENFYEAVNEQIKMEKFILCFNNYISDFKGNIEMKRTNLMALANPLSNGLKIVN